MRPFTTVAASAPSDAEIVASRRPAATSGASASATSGVSASATARLNASGLQNVSHVISRAFARSRVVAKYEHQLLFGDVARVRDIEAKRSRHAFNLTQRIAALAVNATDAAESRLDGKRGDVIALVERDIVRQRALLLLHQPSSVIPAPRALGSVARHDCE